MVAATDAGRPAAAAVGGPLVERFCPVVREDTQKRRIGKAIRVVLEEQGFAWVRSGVLTPGSEVFTSGSVYGRQ